MSFTNCENLGNAYREMLSEHHPQIRLKIRLYVSLDGGRGGGLAHRERKPLTWARIVAAIESVVMAFADFIGG